MLSKIGGRREIRTRHGMGLESSQHNLRLHPKNVAGATELESATFGFGDQCSSQLSYTPVI